jgi:hypothetical protein
MQAVEELKQRFKPEAAKNVHATYLITVNGPGGGSWLTTVNDGQVEFTAIDSTENGAASTTPADCKISIRSEDLAMIIDGKLSAMTAALSGLLSIEGELGLAMQLVPMFFDEPASFL